MAEALRLSACGAAKDRPTGNVSDLATAWAAGVHGFARVVSAGNATHDTPALTIFPMLVLLAPEP